MEMSSAQGRYYLLDNGPVVSPGSCAVCGFSGRERRYLDPRLDFEFFGSVIFCELCIAAMAQLFGYLTPEIARELEVRVETAERELIRLRAAVAAMEDLRVAVRAIDGETTFDGGPDLISDSADQAEFSPDETPDGNATGEGSGNPTFDVSNLVEGPDDLRNVGGSRSFLDLEL